jgi:hypothetical protein
MEYNAKLHLVVYRTYHVVVAPIHVVYHISKVYKEPLVKALDATTWAKERVYSLLSFVVAFLHVPIPIVYLLIYDSVQCPLLGYNYMVAEDKAIKLC